MPASNADAQSTVTEGSALISLGELFKLEERRQEEERDRERRLREQDDRARRERVEQERLHLQARQRAAEQERLARETSEAEDAARLAGMMLGLMSRAKVEAEALAAEQARQADHARTMELARLRQASATDGARRSIAAVAAMGLAAVGALVGAYFGVLEPQHDRALARAQSDAASNAESVREVERQLAAWRQQDTERAERLAALERERDRYKAHAEDLRKALESAGQRTARGTATAARGETAPVEQQKCQFEGDPMCPYIQR